MSQADNLHRLVREENDEQVFLRDRAKGSTKPGSLSSKGRLANLGSWAPAISPNGRFLSFCSVATNLARPDKFVQIHPSPFLEHPNTDVFVRDLRRGMARRASTTSRGRMGNHYSCSAQVANNGDVVFASLASNLVPRDTNQWRDVFVYDWSRNSLQRASVTSRGRQGNERSYAPAISGNGRYVLFYSEASNLVPGDTNGSADVFLRDRKTGRTRRINLQPDGSQSIGGCGREVGRPAISPTGRFVMFACEAGDLVSPPVVLGPGKLYVRDLGSGATELVTVRMDGSVPQAHLVGADMSGDGRYAAFSTNEPGFVPGDEDGDDDIFVRDLTANTTTQLTGGVGLSGTWPTLSGDGRFVVFDSESDQLVAGDTNGERDVFLMGPLR